MAFSGDHSGSTDFVGIPNELKLMFADNLEVADVNALARTSRAENQLLTGYMYRRAAKNRQMRKRRPFFLLAVDGGNPTVVRRFIEAGTCVNIKDLEHAHIETALHSCAYYGHVATAQLLIDNEAKIAVVNKLGHTPLHTVIAGRRPSEAMMELLIDAGADISPNARDLGTVLHTAAEVGTTSMLQLLLDRGADATARNWQGRTPLHVAADSGTATMVRLLLGTGVDVDCTDYVGNTPLHYAVSAGNAKIVKLLLRSGVNIMATNSFQCTPLKLATQDGDCARLLLGRGAR